MNNPFKAPKADLGTGDDDRFHPDYELASRMSRLMAAVVDSLILLFIAWMLLFFSGLDRVKTITTHADSIEFALVTVLLVPVLHLLINGYHLHHKGQTLGKALFYIRVVSVSNHKILPLWQIFLVRYLPVSMVLLIPLVGNLIYIFDSLCIFRRDKRCLHDWVAGTRVVYYRA